jgi:hypothetical protein
VGGWMDNFIVLCSAYRRFASTVSLRDYLRANKIISVTVMLVRLIGQLKQ